MLNREQPKLQSAARAVGTVFMAMALAVSYALPAKAQDERVTMPSEETSIRRAIAEIEVQTGKKFAFSEYFELDRNVSFDPSATSLRAAVETIAGDDHAFTFDGGHILIYPRNLEPRERPSAPHGISAVVIDENTGEPLGNASVEITVNGRTLRTRTAGDGRFTIADIPEGRHIAKITPSGGGTPHYAEVMAAISDAVTEIRYKTYVPDPEPEIAEDTDVPADTAPVTTYYYYEKNDSPAAPRSSRSAVSVIPESTLYSGYMPKAALKTNLLLWGAATPNIGLEFSLGRKWTLDLAYAYNPWHWKDQRSYRFWVVQPEIRYWFCNRFERHFIGLHGIYGQYNMGKFGWPFPDTFKDFRYKGKGYGAGVAYGYHLPVAKRWALEFTVGAGWIRLDYDKYRCGTCDQYEGRRRTDYFGVTKAGVNLVFLIK